MFKKQSNGNSGHSRTVETYNLTTGDQFSFNVIRGQAKITVEFDASSLSFASEAPAPKPEPKPVTVPEHWRHNPTRIGGLKVGESAAITSNAVHRNERSELVIPVHVVPYTVENHERDRYPIVTRVEGGFRLDIRYLRPESQKTLRQAAEVPWIHESFPVVELIE